ncbi:helix-turn-helix domain-containing protein [Streptomyces sp. NPDC088788]|uniref:AlbA family DNA-binding domain-containing protein n=1 Tax=Streptomyces sp. NPDC088788 TaxID=3365898 RepID=UPI00381B4B16
MSYYRRLATLLGTDPAHATADDVRRLLNNPQAAEDQDLDYKLKPHDNGTEGGGELAKDIAALANATGGVLILGLQENRKTSIPVHAGPFELSDGLRRHYMETLASRAAPIVDCQIHYATQEHVDGEVPKGFALVMVPPSSRAPHAVTGLNDTKDGTLRFPVRTGSGTRCMTPTEVETAFFDKQSRRALREERHDQLRAALDKEKSLVEYPTRWQIWGKKARLVFSLVPNTPGDMAWDQQGFQRYQQQVRDELSLVGEPHTTFNVVEPAPLGFVARQEQGSTRQVIAVFADDGSSAVEYPLHVQSARGPIYDDDDEALDATP